MNAAHLHLLVNHLPIVGFAFGLILLAATLFRRGDRGMFVAAALVVVVISGAGGLAAKFMGEPAEEVVEHLPGVSEGLMESHEKAGLIATILASITTMVAIVLSFVTLEKKGESA